VGRSVAASVGGSVAASVGRSVASSTWPDVAAATTSGPIILAVPLGSTEQHGPHLPLDTDTRVAVALAESLGRHRPDVAVAPALAYGASGEHAAFPGTLSIGHGALELILLELVRSADAFAGVVLVNGHGGNTAPVERARQRLTAEGRRVLAWSPHVDGGDAHAGRTETSMMLALAPAAVAVDRAEPGATEPLAVLLPRLMAEGVDAVSPNGVLGDPSGSSAAEGQALLDRLAADLAVAVAEWWDPAGPPGGCVAQVPL
jgi:creatinine amidohydrolase